MWVLDLVILNYGLDLEGYRYVEFDGGLGLIELKETFEPWQRCAPN